MRWAHLPVAGGLYDQDPELLRKFDILFREIDAHEAEEQKKREAEYKRTSSKHRPSRTPMRGGRVRRR